MKRAIYTLLYILICASASAQGQFNYNKWKAEQQKATATSEVQVDENLLNSTTAYAYGFVQAGHLHGPGVSIGAFFHDVNIELGYVHGLSESYQISRHFSNSEVHAYTYQPKAFEAKVGYGIRTMGCLRITPQAGITLVNVNGEQANETTTRSKETGKATDFVASLRVDFAFLPHFGISITPQYCTKISNDATYESIVSESNTKDIRNWSEGLTCRFGLYINL